MIWGEGLVGGLCWQAYVVAGEVDVRGRACLAHIKEGGRDQGENDEEHLG